VDVKGAKALSERLAEAASNVHSTRPPRARAPQVAREPEIVVIPPRTAGERSRSDGLVQMARLVDDDGRSVD
jgi:hypothetical protein